MLGGSEGVREQTRNVSKAAGRGGSGQEVGAVGRRAVGRHACHVRGYERRAAVSSRPVSRQQVSGHAHRLPTGRGCRCPVDGRRPVLGRRPDRRGALSHAIGCRLGHQRRAVPLANVPGAGPRENRLGPPAVRRRGRRAGRVRGRTRRPRGWPSAGVHVRVPGPTDGPRFGRTPTVDQGLRLRGLRGPERRGRAARVTGPARCRRGPGGRAQRRVRHHAVQPVRHAGHPRRSCRRRRVQLLLRGTGGERAQPPQVSIDRGTHGRQHRMGCVWRKRCARSHHVQVRPKP